MKRKKIIIACVFLLFLALSTGITFAQVQPTPFPEPCNSCNGKGGATCHGCFGSGVFYSGYNRSDCSLCKGTGWLQCRPCNGTGRR